MNIEITFVLILTKIFVAISILIQTAELLSMRETLTSKGIWDFETIAPEYEIFSRPTQHLLRTTLGNSSFPLLLWLQLFLSVALFISVFLVESIVPLCIPPLLLITTLLVALRFRGTFNGGSDYITVVVLLSLSLISFFPDSKEVNLFALLYIATQSLLSYFISGISKLKSRNWHSGEALRRFVNSGPHELEESLLTKFNGLYFTKLLAYSVLAFELLFPLAVLLPQITLIYLALGALFHLANSRVLGLNRFLFAWLATYPSIYLLSLYLN
jgi:hypothetical protein